jgi:hypothetical protein
MEILNGRHDAEKLDENKLLTPNLSKTQIGEINRELLSAGVSVYDISASNKDLESIFIDLIGK